MEFSELFHGRCSTFSPNGKLISCICGDFVEIRYADTLLKAFKFECGEIVKAAKWSADSLLIICQAGPSGLKIFSVHSGSCIASLKQTMSNVNEIHWASDCRTVLFTEPLLFRVAVWRICEQYGQLGLNYFNDVQPWAKPGVSLSANGKHLAVVLCGIIPEFDSFEEASDIREQRPDQIAIFSVISWRKETSVRCDGIQRVGGIAWSPYSQSIVVWPSDPPDPVLIICVQKSSVIGKWQSSDKLWAGVCSVEFSPSAQYMTIIGQNSRVHVVNCVAWCEELELDHNSCIKDLKCKVYEKLPALEEENSLFNEVKERPVSISFLSSLNKTKTISSVAWSSGGRYLASCLALAPAVVWVWSTADLFASCCVIVTKHPVEDFKWDPVRNILAVVDGQDSVMLWNADEGNLKCSCVCTPLSKMLFQARNLNWCHNGQAIVVSSEQTSTVLELPFAYR